MSADRRPWNQKTHWILVSLLLLPPLGIVLVWRSRWPKVVRKTVLGLWALLLLVALTSSPGEHPQVATAPTAPAVPQSTPSSQPTLEPTPAREVAPPAAAPVVTESFDPALLPLKNRISATTAVLISQEVGAQINVRQWPSTSSTAMHYGRAGNVVTLLYESPGDDGRGWYEVQFEESGATGWIRSDFITQDLIDAPAEFVDPTAPLPSPSTPLDPNAPIRDAYIGTCDCPYDLASNGSRCGGRSAYSKPGGRAPICYVGDQ